MAETFKKTDTRVNDILLGPLERPALRWFCVHMPPWVTPDMLTAVGVAGGLIIALGYWLSNIDKNFLWLADVGFIVNWFGDSLDGSLARHRKIERFQYGYFLDHTVDTLTQTFICIGLGLSPFISFNYAMLALVGYLQLGILTYVQTAVTGVFKLSYGKIGPTEMRVILVGLNAVFYCARNPVLALPFVTVALFDLLALIAAIAFFVYFIVFMIMQAAELNRRDRAGRTMAAPVASPGGGCGG
ncbi:MAG TPA: CDP-alcohol phosphatidyltransferase family protein [Methylomirabilota bacterium]|nr:CDP-alcohol phosphatidyltransferase family protein [Methylomirabilota bacterium]